MGRKKLAENEKTSKDQVLISLKPAEREQVNRVKREYGFGTDQDAIMDGFRRGHIDPYVDRQRKLDEEVEIRRRLSRDGG